MANWWNDTAFSLGDSGPYWVKGARVGYNSSSSFGDLGWVKNPFKGLVPNPYAMPEMKETLPAVSVKLQLRLYSLHGDLSSVTDGRSSAVLGKDLSGV